MAQKKNRKALRLIPVNKGIEAWYHRKLQQVVREIHTDIQKTVLADYKQTQQTHRIAMDGILDWVGHAMDLLVQRWSDRLLGLGEEISTLFLDKNVKNYDKQFKSALKAHGFTVDLVMTDYIKAVARDSIAMNTALIRSIGNQYLEKVQLHVWEAVGSGLSVSDLSANLQHDFGVARRRANNIARDQIDKAHSAIEHARRLEIGITEAQWVHSFGGKKPRQSHIKANGKTYDISKGMFIDGEWIFPAQKINCRCTSRGLLPFANQSHIELKILKAA